MRTRLVRPPTNNVNNNCRLDKIQKWDNKDQTKELFLLRPGPILLIGALSVSTFVCPCLSRTFFFFFCLVAAAQHRNDVPRLRHELHAWLCHARFWRGENAERFGSLLSLGRGTKKKEKK